MHKLASAKIFFCLAVLLFVAKPFLGFSMFNHRHPPAVENILVKAFTKRKPEDPEHSITKTEAVQKKLAEQAKVFILRFSFLLGIIFPLAFASLANSTPRFLRGLQLSLPPQRDTWLLNGKLI